MVKTMKEQAAERGLPVPVGKTAGELRERGWDVSADVPDTAVLTAVPSSSSTLGLTVSTDHSWSYMLPDRIFQLAYVADAVMETPELRERLPLIADEVIEELSKLAIKAQNKNQMTLSRYYLVLQNFVKTLSQ